MTPRGHALALVFAAGVAACAAPASQPASQSGPQSAPQAGAAARSGGEAGRTRPNIVIFFADDLGYGGIGVQGDREARTPHIDALAGSGVRLTDYYAGHPVCSPSRAQLMTGVYQHRMGFEHNSGSPQGASLKFGIAADVPTLPERLKAAGYATGMFGKWHVGFRPETQPTARGFDAFYGHLAGAHPYTPEGAAGREGRPARDSMLRGTQKAPMPDHITEALGEEAAAFVRANRDRPFFIYLPFNAVHSPVETTPEYEAKFAHIQNRTRRVHLAQLAAMDDAVGRVMATLEAEGLTDDTLVIFTSDNGGPTQQTTSSNGPLNGAKGLVLEGGVRVPAILSWQGRLPAGRVDDVVATSFDLTATALAAAGAAPASGIDGVDLTPFLTGGRDGDPHEAIYWRSGTQGAMRSGPWKLVKADDDWYLFNLETDIGERKNLAAAEPQRLADMQTAWRTWSASMKDPLWVRNERSGGDPPRGQRISEVVRRLVNGEQVTVAAPD